MGTWSRDVLLLVSLHVMGSDLIGFKKNELFFWFILNITFANRFSVTKLHSQMTLVKKQTEANHAVGDMVEEEDIEKDKRRKDLGCTTSS